MVGAPLQPFLRVGSRGGKNRRQLPLVGIEALRVAVIHVPCPGAHFVAPGVNLAHGYVMRGGQILDQPRLGRDHKLLRRPSIPAGHLKNLVVEFFFPQSVPVQHVGGPQNIKPLPHVIPQGGRKEMQAIALRPDGQVELLRNRRLGRRNHRRRAWQFRGGQWMRQPVSLLLLPGQRRQHDLFHRAPAQTLAGELAPLVLAFVHPVEQFVFADAEQFTSLQLR
jgi:hypothetical protein